MRVEPSRNSALIQKFRKRSTDHDRVGESPQSAGVSPLAVHRYRVPFDNLPLHLEGLKILHISDLHARSAQKIQPDIWQRISRINADMAVITGDMVVRCTEELLPHVPHITALAKCMPCFYVEGNHESPFYEQMAGLLAGCGVNVLENERRDFALGAAASRCTPPRSQGAVAKCIADRRDMARRVRDLPCLRSDMARHVPTKARLQQPPASRTISVAGFRDFYRLQKRGFADIKPLLAELAGSKGFHILLSHQPQIFDWFVKWSEMPAGKLPSGKVPSVLIFAGHTHGGQIRLPFLPTLVAPGQGILPPYGDGWYACGAGKRVKMYISRGIGATYFPVRLFNPPEAAVVELRRPDRSHLTTTPHSLT